MHLIHSKIIKGAGVVSGGPYGYFLKHSETVDAHVKVENLFPFCSRFDQTGKIDSLKNIVDSKVYIYAGEYDHNLAPGIAEKTFDFYNKLGAIIKFDINKNSAHSMLTDLPEFMERDNLREA